jgi:hypothetical protein
MKLKQIISCALAFIGIAAALSAQAFTLAVIPDTQNYCDYRYQTTSTPPFAIDQADIYYRQMKYIAANSAKNGGPVVFAIHLGDLVQNQGTQRSEWEVADKAMSILDDTVPYGIVPGNHDYDKAWNDQTDKQTRVDGSSLYNTYFGPGSRHFAGKEWYCGSFDNGLNSWSTFTGGGQTFLFLGLELEPSDESIAWAQKVLDAHKNIPVILVTHEYISYAYDSTAPGTAFRLEDAYRKGMNRNTPQQLWEKLITKNKQIFLVLCGHNWNGDEAEGARTDTNDAGFKVYQLLSDYQGRADLKKFLNIDDGKMREGDGWMRLMEFDLAKGEIHVQTYSTELNRYEKDANSDFIIKFDWDWNSRFAK